jgi:hypothetical protein
MGEFSPRQPVEHDNPNSRFNLILDSSSPMYLTTGEVFERHSLDALGYAWSGVLDALKRVAGLIREVRTNPAMLEEAFENADPDLLD